MKCYGCKEQIEVGEACKTEYLIGTHLQYFHPGCHLEWHAKRTQTKQEADAEFEALALQARSVC